MAKPRYVVREMVTGGGPLRASFEANQEWLDYFSPRERNAVVNRSGLRAAGNMRLKFFRDRINARKVKAPPFSYRARTNSPMIGDRSRDDPSKLINRIHKGKIRTSTKGSKKGQQQLMVTIPVPFGHPVTKEIVRVWRILPEYELQYFADWVMRYAFDYRDKAKLKQPKRMDARPRYELTAAQRRAMGIKPRKKRTVRAR